MADLDNPVVEEGAAHSSDTTRSAASIVDNQTEMSRTLDRAGEALDTVKVWKTTANTIKWVMDTVSPILKVCTK
jgi:hypothetical protein